MRPMRMLAVIVLCIFGAFAHPYVATATTLTGSCLQQDAGYGLVGAGGKIDVIKLYTLAVLKFEVSNLKGQTNASLGVFGVKTGDPREWARLFVMVCQQESGCRIAPKYADGTLQKFATTPPNEKSYGPLQFNIGEYGLSSWDAVNSPSCTLDAFIRVAQQGKLFNYFGSMQRPNEVMRHAGWFNTTVVPFADSSQLNYDPNAAAANFRAIQPYLSQSTLNANGLMGGTNGFNMGNAGSPSTGQSAGQGNVGSSGSSGAAYSQPQQPQQSAPQRPISTMINPSAPVTNSGGGTTSAVPTTQAVGTPALGIAAIYRANTSGSGALLAWSSLNMDSGSCKVVTSSGALIKQSQNGGTFAQGLTQGSVVQLKCTSRGQAYSASATVAQ